MPCIVRNCRKRIKRIEVAVLRHGKELEMLDAETVEKICEEIAKEDAEDKKAEA